MVKKKCGEPYQPENYRIFKRIPTGLAVYLTLVELKEYFFPRGELYPLRFITRGNNGQIAIEKSSTAKSFGTKVVWNR